MIQNLKQKTFKGTLWSTIERLSVHGVDFVVMIIMARFLTPKDYGLVGMLTIFIAISQSLVDSGFSQALIRKQDRSELDNSTVFFFNIGIGFLLYVLLFFLAPVISNFYDEPILIPLTRVISFSILINSFVVVQRALLTVQIDFKTQTKASFTAALCSGIVGIIMVSLGLGLWSIVWAQLINLFINCLMLWILSKWRPKLIFSWSSFKELFGFGSKLAISGVLDTLYNNIYLIIIGKVFKAADLGYYTRAQQFASFPSSSLTGILQRVIFPVLCTIQDNDDKLRSVYRVFLRLSAFIIFPLMIMLSVLSKPLILLLLGEQWSFASTLLSIICIQMMWFPIHSINLSLLQVKGRSDLFLKIEVLKKCVGIAILCITIPFGLIPMCIGAVFSSIICLTINTHYTGKLIQVGFLKQMRDLYPSLIYSILTGITVFLINQIISSLALELVVGIILGVGVYLSLAQISNSEDLKSLKSIIKK